MLTVVLWSGTPVAIRYATDILAPFSVAGIRFAIAAIFMLAWTKAHGTSIKVNRRDFVLPLIGGFLLFLQIGTFTQGVFWSNASHGTVFINTFIFWIVAIEHWVTRASKLSVRAILGLTMAAVSVVIVLSTTGQLGESNFLESASIEGDALLLVSALLLGIKIVFTKHAVKTVQPDAFIFWHDVVGVFFFFVVAFTFEGFDPRLLLRFEDPQVLHAWWGLLYQGLAVAGLCFAIYARLLTNHLASSIAVFSFATPLFGILFAVLFRNEQLSPWLFLAGAFVAAGIFLVNWPDKKSPTSQV
jgi:drug/metabolite transporter (DMT)-like permease